MIFFRLGSPKLARWVGGVRYWGQSPKKTDFFLHLPVDIEATLLLRFCNMLKTFFVEKEKTHKCFSSLLALHVMNMKVNSKGPKGECFSRQDSTQWACWTASHPSTLLTCPQIFGQILHSLILCSKIRLGFDSIDSQRSLLPNYILPHSWRRLGENVSLFLKITSDLES